MWSDVGRSSSPETAPRTGSAEQVIIVVTVAATLVATIVIVALARRRGRGAAGQ